MWCICSCSLSKSGTIETTLVFSFFQIVCIGLEDTFRTAATEVSLLAGSEEFNATKLFEVGK